MQLIVSNSLSSSGNIRFIGYIKEGISVGVGIIKINKCGNIKNIINTHLWIRCSVIRKFCSKELNHLNFHGIVGHVEWRLYCWWNVNNNSIIIPSITADCKLPPFIRRLCRVKRTAIWRHLFLRDDIHTVVLLRIQVFWDVNQFGLSALENQGYVSSKLRKPLTQRYIITSQKNWIWIRH
jgi:hypothetical protein